MRFIVALLIASLFVDKADSELSFIPRPKDCIHALHISLEFAPSNIAIPTLSRQSHKPLIHYRSITAGEQVQIEKLTLGLGIIRIELMTSTTSR
ncbi:hypothetical protein KSP40_PGU003020 [Platanthera guangdongensis]|uniref:Uncharacterized protein n=1 Tax=Platanthera guangdongensis TaxID=2320717 RepID=A0ABR2MPZ8_9ASPA